MQQQQHGKAMGEGLCSSFGLLAEEDAEDGKAWKVFGAFTPGDRELLR